MASVASSNGPTDVSDIIRAANIRIGVVLRERDLVGFREIMSADVVGHSPYLTGHEFRFSGRDELCQAMWVFMNEVDDFAVVDQFVAGNRGAVEFTASIRKQKVHGVFVNSFREDGTLVLSDLLIRGFSGLATFGRVFGPGLTRLHSRTLAFLPLTLTPLAEGMAMLINGIGSPLVLFSLKRIAPGIMKLPLRRR